MKVLVDGNELRQVSPDGEPLAQIYRELVGGLFREGRTVVAVTLDGRTLKDDDLTRLLDGEESPGETLDLQTLDTAELSRATLAEISTHLERLREGLKMTVDHLGRAERAKALAALRPTLEIWLAVCEAVQKVCLLSQIELTAEREETTAGTLQESLVGSLGDVQSAIEQEDWVRLADLLEYELMPSVTGWDTLVKAVLDRLQGDVKA